MLRVLAGRPRKCVRTRVLTGRCLARTPSTAWSSAAGAVEVTRMTRARPVNARLDAERAGRPEQPPARSPSGSVCEGSGRVSAVTALGFRRGGSIGRAGEKANLLVPGPGKYPRALVVNLRRFRSQLSTVVENPLNSPPLPTHPDQLTGSTRAVTPRDNSRQGLGGGRRARGEISPLEARPPPRRRDLLPGGETSSPEARPPPGRRDLLLEARRPRDETSPENRGPAQRH